jgi:hypothetical protein
MERIAVSLFPARSYANTPVIVTSLRCSMFGGRQPIGVNACDY